MITDKTLDEALVELLRTKRALEALRVARHRGDRHCTNHTCNGYWKRMGDECVHCDTKMALYRQPIAEHAAAKRASLDLTRKLADLRAGR